MLIGGKKKKGAFNFESVTNTYTINVKDDTVIEGPALNTGRGNLACEKVVIDTKTYIFAIGGYDRDSSVPRALKSVEILEVGTDTWKTGKYQYSSTLPFGLWPP